MVRPFLGSEANARSILSAVGEDVLLEDGSTIAGVFRSRAVTEYDGAVAVQRTYTVLGVPDVLGGSIRQGQTLTARGARWYAAAALSAGDGWSDYVLNEQES